MTPTQQDRELIEATLQGQTEAYGELVKRYQDRLFHSLCYMLGSREDAKDIAQQTFVRAFQKLSQFRHDSAFYSWLFRIALNEAASYRRRKRPELRLEDVPEDERKYDPSDPHRDVMPAYQVSLRETQRLVWQAINQLPEEFRQVLVLKEMDNLSYEQIAEIIGCPIGTVRSRLFRARSALRKKLEKEIDKML